MLSLPGPVNVDSSPDDWFSSTVPRKHLHFPAFLLVSM